MSTGEPSWGIKEEINHNCGKAIFTTQKADKNKAIEDVCALFDKWGAVFEDQIPTEGFIQGLPYPTPADLALLDIALPTCLLDARGSLPSMTLGNGRRLQRFVIESRLMNT
jgi:hypothetical protein